MKTFQSILAEQILFMTSFVGLLRELKGDILPKKFVTIFLNEKRKSRNPGEKTEIASKGYRLKRYKSKERKRSRYLRDISDKRGFFKAKLNHLGIEVALLRGYTNIKLKY